MSKENRKAIYEYIFKEGVLVAKKDFKAPTHPNIDVPNLHVIKAMQVRLLVQCSQKYIICSLILTRCDGETFVNVTIKNQYSSGSINKFLAI